MHTLDFHQRNSLSPSSSPTLRKATSPSTKAAPTAACRTTESHSKGYEPILVTAPTSSGYSSDQYWSRREAVLVAITNQYWSTQRAVLVVKTTAQIVQKRITPQAAEAAWGVEFIEGCIEVDRDS